MTDPNWLDEHEQRAWRGFIALDTEVHRRIARQLQRETGLSSADYLVLVSLSEAPGGRLRRLDRSDSCQISTRCGSATMPCR